MGLKPEEISVGTVVECMTHRWEIIGVYLGVVGQESVVELRNVSHTDAESYPKRHRRMFVPEVLLRAAAYIPYPTAGSSHAR